ncbi:hypothetical protein FP513_14620 [Escherichia coli]|nr:hypothetical protein FP513_14620 [Escherichia coli]
MSLRTKSGSGKHFTTVNDHHPCSDSGCFREKNQLVAGDIMIIPSRSGEGQGSPVQCNKICKNDTI